jgi:hypothetical protein
LIGYSVKAILAKGRACGSAGRPDIVAPTRERQQHDKVERIDKPIADGAGGVARSYRVVDILAAMERRGSITAGTRLAGETFRQKFTAAHLASLHAANLHRSARGQHGSGPTERMIAAREVVWRAICAVGRLASVDGSCLWQVVGFER